jgi:dipeptidyl aminopeptidase/acylaminoacyl peptidase
MRILLVFALCLTAFGAKFDIAQNAKIVRVSDPQISPDGKSIVAVVSRANFDENRYDAELALIDVASRKQRVLTHDRRGVGFARWSPTGDRLAFLALGAGGKSQIFVLPLAGGDAVQLTKSTTGVQQFTWRPDGDAIAFAMSDEAEKRGGEEKFNDVFEVKDNDYLITSLPLPTHLWMVAAGGGIAKRLTSGEWTVPINHPPGSPASPIAWSPDGKSIAFVKVASPYSGDGDQSSLQILDVGTGITDKVTGRTKSEGYPSYSPDGRTLSYWFPRDAEPKNVNEIYTVAATGGDGKSVTRGLDRNVVRAIWMPDGKSMLVGAADGTTVGMWIQPVNGAKAKRIEIGKIVPTSAFWLDASVSAKGEIAFAGSEPTRPTEVYYLASAGGKVERLTDFNASTAALELGKTESIEWDGPNGLHQDGVVTYPPDFTSGKKYALVLYIHGGPRSASKEAFSARAQLLAANGWVVFEPNYRGSDNLGNQFQAAIWNDSGDGPGRDVMSGIEVLKKRGFVDEARMAVTGWSYGGYMTTWLEGHYPIWKAAVAGAAVTDWLDQYDLGDANVRRANGFGGSPYTDSARMQAFVEQSPITNAPKIRTPTLILSDVGDYRVTITQSYKLYHALKDNGVPTRFFAYPIPGHSPTDPVRQRDIDKKWVAWLQKYLDGNDVNSSAF